MVSHLVWGLTNDSGKNGVCTEDVGNFDALNIRVGSCSREGKHREIIGNKDICCVHADGGTEIRFHFRNLANQSKKNSRGLKHTTLRGDAVTVEDWTNVNYSPVMGRCCPPRRQAPFFKG